MAKLIPTTVVGSYPQPDWLVDRQALMSGPVPRVRRSEIWRVPEAYLEAAQDDATLVAIRDQERAGIDIITDGEIRRESYSNRFATALKGIDNENPAMLQAGRAGRPTAVPRVTARIEWTGPVEVRDVEFLRANTDRKIQDHAAWPVHYGPTGRRRALQGPRGDDDGFRRRRQPRGAGARQGRRGCHPTRRAVAAQQPRRRQEVRGPRRSDRALAGLDCETALHLCFGYAQLVSNKPQGYAFLSELSGTTAQQISIESAQPKIDLGVLGELKGKKVILGVIDLGTHEIETPEVVAARLRAGLKHVAPENLIAAPDCGMK